MKLTWRWVTCIERNTDCDAGFGVKFPEIVRRCGIVLREGGTATGWDGCYNQS